MSPTCRQMLNTGTRCEIRIPSERNWECPCFEVMKLLVSSSFYKLEVQPFTEKQIDLVTTFADQAVIAIENTRLFEEVQERNRELRATLEQQTATSAIL